jgi:hypothetical protein
LIDCLRRVLVDPVSPARGPGSTAIDVGEVTHDI